MLLLALICPPLRPHARTGHRAWARGAGESKNLPSPRHAPGCHGDAMTAICVLKGFFLREGHFYLFIFVRAGSSLLRGLFSSCGEPGSALWLRLLIAVLSLVAECGL